MCADGLVRDGFYLYRNALQMTRFTWLYDRDDVIKWNHFPRYWPVVKGIHPSPVDSPLQRPVARSCDVFFDLHLHKRLSSQSRCRWFETPSRSLWRHCDVLGLQWSYPVCNPPVLHQETARISGSLWHQRKYHHLVGSWLGNRPRSPRLRLSNHPHHTQPLLWYRLLQEDTRIIIIKIWCHGCLIFIFIQRILVLVRRHVHIKISPRT